MDYEVKYTFFNAYLCHVCKTKESFKDAKLCSCKLIAYCGREHQKADWRNHKSICNATRSICRGLQQDDVFNAGSNMFRLCQETNSVTSQSTPKLKWWKLILWVRSMIGDVLKRELYKYEMKMLHLPKHCAVCFSRNVKKEFVCTNCFAAAYCSEEHKNSDRHQEVCVHLQKSLDVDLFMLSTSSKALQIPLIDPNKAVNLKLDAHDMQSFIANYIKPGLKFEEEALVSFYYTNVLTFADTVNQIPNFTLGEKLTIHIVGAESTCEGRVLQYWENLLHLFPKLCAVTLVHIGPFIDGSPFKLVLCDDCNNAKKSVDILVHCQTYHEYHRSPGVQKPDVIVAFNSGLFGKPAEVESGFFGDPAGDDPWEPSFQFFFQYENIPVILTEPSKVEIEIDLERLLSRDVVCDKKVKVCVDIKLNPYNDLRLQNTCMDHHELPSKNSYACVLIAAC